MAAFILFQALPSSSCLALFSLLPLLPLFPLSLWSYADDSSALACVPFCEWEKSTPFVGTDAYSPKHDRPQMHQWMEYATVQTCNAA